jgi:hypothetical protein
VGWRGEGAGGPLGRRARKEGRVSLVFFFSFSNSFQIKLLLSNSNQNSSNLFTKFYKLLNFTQATKSYAKSNNDAQTLVVSILINLSLIF